MSSHEGFCGLFTKNQSSRVPTCAWQEYLGQSRLILASFPQRSRRPMCQRQADQVDMIMFRPGDPLNFSWHSHGVSQAGGWRVGGRDHVSPGNRVYFGWCSTGVLSDQSCPGWQAGGGVDLPDALSCFDGESGKHRLAFALCLPSRWSQSCPSRQAW